MWISQGGSAIITANFPSTDMSSLRRSHWIHWRKKTLVLVSVLSRWWFETLLKIMLPKNMRLQWNTFCKSQHQISRCGQDWGVSYILQWNHGSIVNLTKNINENIYKTIQIGSTPTFVTWTDTCGGNRVVEPSSCFPAALTSSFGRCTLSG